MKEILPDGNATTSPAEEAVLTKRKWKWLGKNLGGRQGAKTHSEVALEQEALRMVARQD